MQNYFRINIESISQKSNIPIFLAGDFNIEICPFPNLHLLTTNNKPTFCRLIKNKKVTSQLDWMFCTHDY